MKEISLASGVFLGDAGSQAFSLDISMLRERKYQLAGKLVSWSIIHGGPGLSSLSRTVLELMMSPDVDVDPEADIKVIPDVEVRGNLIKVLNYSQ